MSMDRDRLQRLLGGDELTRVRHRLRQRLLRDGGGTLTVSRPSEAERQRVEQLLGRPPRSGQTLRIPLDELQATLQRAGIAPSLRDALEALDGPLRDGTAERAAVQERWRQAVEALRPRAEAAGVTAWLEAMVAQGLLKRLAADTPEHGLALLRRSLEVLEALPQHGTSLSALAARTLGDAHALDSGRPEATLIRHALHRYWRGGAGDDNADERTLWARAGVLVGGDITSTVLIHRLPAAGQGATDRAAAAHHQTAEPLYLTLRQLLRQPPQWAVAGQTVYVCENPTVVAEAAERLGTGCAPLVATLGRPRAAAWVLLEQLRSAGAELAFRADFDWTGVAIANAVSRRFSARPWRMDTGTLAEHADLPGSSLSGKPVIAEWDAKLHQALESRGAALHEEQILETLLADLAKM